MRAADGHDADPPWLAADEPHHVLRSAHLTPLQCDFQLSSTKAHRAKKKCAASRLWPSGAKLVKSATQSLINYHQLWDGTIGQRFCRPPSPGKVTTKCDLQWKVDCIYTRAVYHPGSVRLPFIHVFFIILNLFVRFTWDDPNNSHWQPYVQMSQQPHVCICYKLHMHTCTRLDNSLFNLVSMFHSLKTFDTSHDQFMCMDICCCRPFCLRQQLYSTTY